MSKNGRLEAKITVPTGGYSVSATNFSGGPSTCTIAAGSYYPSTLLTAFAAALNASRPSSWVVFAGLGEGGTGIVTINGTSAWSIVWTSTTLRDLLGFASNITAAVTQQAGVSAMKGVWLPDCPSMSEDDLTTGAYVSDQRASISPSGAVYTMVGNTYRRRRGDVWPAVSKDRARATTSAPMTFEQFWYETQLGGYSAAFAGGSRLALYTDASANTLLGYYHATKRDTTDMDQMIAEWAGRWKIELPELILQSGA